MFNIFSSFLTNFHQESFQLTGVEPKIVQLKNKKKLDKKIGIQTKILKIKCKKVYF